MFPPYTIARNAVMLIGYLTLSALFVLRFRMPKLGVKGLIVAMLILAIILGSLFLIRRAVLA